MQAHRLALAAGAPWGEFAMGSAYPGQFPPELRMAAVVQAVVLGLLALVVLARAGIALPKWRRASRRLVQVAVSFSALSLVLNSITPSARERMVWSPVALVMLASSLTVALNKSAE